MSEGELIIDDYQLINCVATGNVSQVWEAKQRSTSQQYALKLLLPEALEDPEQRRALKHEATVGKQFEHPFIIRVFEARVRRKQAYFIMEYFRAPNVKTLIHTDPVVVHLRLPKLMECVTQAYAYMHEKNWIHKDIKPDNILLTKGGEVRVIDFSLAARPTSLMARMTTKKGGFVIQGTRTYIAPELIRREPLTPAADIYSLGVTLFEALTGRPPFMGGSPNELLMKHVGDRPEPPSGYHPNVTPEADALVLKMLAKKPKDRHESMQEVFAEARTVKFFKQDPQQYAQDKLASAEERFLDSVDQRLDSRADAARTEKYGRQPATPKPKPKPQAPQPASPAPQAPAAQAGQPMPYPGMMPPQYPPMAPPPMMPPQPMYPQQPMMPPMVGAPLPPGQAPPQHPQAVPPAPTTQSQQPGAKPAAESPASPPQPAAAQQPAPPPKKEEYVSLDDLDFMTELPDVI